MERSTRVGRFGPRSLIFRVLVVVLVPTIALQFFTWREVSQQRDTNASAELVVDDVQLLQRTSPLVVPVYLELALTDGIARAEGRGISRDQLEELTGIDFLGMLGEARTQVDDRLAALDRGSGHHDLGTGTVHDQVAASQSSLAVLRQRFDAKALSAEESGPATEAVLRGIDDMIESTGGDLQRAARTGELIDLATETDQLLMVLEYASEELDHLAQASISGNPQVPLTSMMSDSGALDASLRQLRKLVSEPRRVALDDLTNGPAFKAVAETLPEFLDQITFASRRDTGIVTNTDNMDVVVQLMTASIDRLHEIEHYAETFLQQQYDRALKIQRDAARARVVALAVMIGAAALSLVLLVLVMRSVLRPLARLVRQARKVRAGDLSLDPVKPTGPTDLRVVTRAFNEMLSTLKAYESQLDRLARGDTKVDPTLPGPLGDTLRRSVSQVASLTAQLHASEAAATRQARTDALTGLANRTAALERLAVMAMQARQNGTPAAIIFLDLDGFKSVNDTQGHAEGDRILSEIADRLREACPDDVVARIGGDEFLVLIDSVTDIDQVTERAHRLIDVVSAPVAGSQGQLFTLSASAGASVIDGHRDALDSVAQADTAVYHAKERGRGRVEVFDERLARTIEERAEMALTMRHGLAEGQFFLCLQPIIDVATSHPVGAEVLLRWNRPGLGEVGPNEFIPIAERTGVIVDLEKWVLEQAVGILRDWRLDATTSRMRLAVNISGRHIVEGNLAPFLDELCHRAMVDPTLIDLEITETHLVADIARAGTVVDDLRAQGVQVAIDDFGTGYSSMTYLHRLTVDTLKIDQIFVAGMCDDRLDRTIVELLLRLGDSLGMNVVAEGVDSETKLSLLKELGCPWAQGFYIARPMAVADATRWLRQQEALASSLT